MNRDHCDNHGDTEAQRTANSSNVFSPCLRASVVDLPAESADAWREHERLRARLEQKIAATEGLLSAATRPAKRNAALSADSRPAANCNVRRGAVLKGDPDGHRGADD